MKWVAVSMIIFLSWLAGHNTGFNDGFDLGQNVPCEYESLEKKLEKRRGPNVFE